MSNKLNLDSIADLLTTFTGNNNNNFDISKITSILSGMGIKPNSNSSNDFSEILSSFLGKLNSENGNDLSSLFSSTPINTDSEKGSALEGLIQNFQNSSAKSPFGGLNSEQVNSLLSRTNLSEDHLNSFMDLLDNLKQRNDNQTEQMAQLKEFFKGIFNTKK